MIIYIIFIAWFHGSFFKNIFIFYLFICFENSICRQRHSYVNLICPFVVSSHTRSVYTAITTQCGLTHLFCRTIRKNKDKFDTYGVIKNITKYNRWNRLYNFFVLDLRFDKFWNDTNDINIAHFKIIDYVT